MFNLFSKDQEPEDLTPSGEVPSEEDTQKVIQKYKEQVNKEKALYSKIVKNDEDLARALRTIVHRLDLITNVKDIEPLASRLASMYPESAETND